MRKIFPFDDFIMIMICDTQFPQWFHGKYSNEKKIDCYDNTHL